MMRRNVMAAATRVRVLRGARLSSAAAPPPPPAKEKKPAEAPAKASPMQNLRDAMDALDLMIAEAEKKVVKKYRPNMFAEFKQLNDTNGKVCAYTHVRF